ncbi:MAG: DNA polymerase IV [Bacilli bacterium]
MDRLIMHIDVNNAFLSWTAVNLLQQGNKNDIRNSYAVIGGDPNARKGIVLAKSTPAKKMGIYTSETLYSAKKKCPSLKVYEPNYELYTNMSNKLFNLLNKYSPDIEVASIDECYLDYGKVKNLYGDEIEFAYTLKNEIKKTLGFTVNIGIANNKLCAKMASDFTKPDQVHTLYRNEIRTKMHCLPINDLFGIGKKTSAKLMQLGINTIGDLSCFDVNILERYFKNQAHIFIDMANGIDNNEVISALTMPVCISNEVTLTNDATNKEMLYPYLMSLASSVGLRVRKQKKFALVICVVIKDNYFKRKSHQRKLKNATNITDEIYKVAKEILDEMYEDEQVRLIGIRLDRLVDNVSYQSSLFEDENIRNDCQKVEEVVDNLKEKYGNKIINKASLTKD